MHMVERCKLSLIGVRGAAYDTNVLISYPDPNVRNDDHRLQYDIMSYDHRYVHLGLGTRLQMYRHGLTRS